MRTELLNRCGIVLLAAGVAGLLVGLALRTAGPGWFALIAMWTLLPYGACLPFTAIWGAKGSKPRSQCCLRSVSSLLAHGSRLMRCF